MSTTTVPALIELRVGDLLDETVAEAIAMSIPADQLHAAAIRIDTIRRVTAKVLQHVELRISTELKNAGYTDPDTGDRYEFIGAASWEVRDPTALMAELIAAQVDPEIIKRSFRTKIEVLHTDLNRIVIEGGPAAEIITDHRARKYGPRHLVNVSAKEERKTR